jgi:hypothetical protein
METKAESRAYTRAALAIFVLALALRLWGIGFALPYDFTADEPHHIVQALRIGAGEGGPLLRIWHTVGKGGLDYLLFFEYGLLFLFWRLTGHISSADDFALRYLEDPTAFYLLGRLTIAVLGALTCLVVFHVGKRMFDERVGLAASLIGATAYFHGAQSHVINVHVPMAFALWAGIACYLEYERRGNLRFAAAAGFLVGSATALAYTAAIGLGVVLLALATSPSSPRRRALPAAAIFASFVAAVALMSPDLLLGLGKLASNFGGTREVPPASATADPGELRDSIDSVTILREHDALAYVEILGKPVSLAVSLGALAGAFLGLRGHARWTGIVALVSLVFLIVVSASQRSAAERYLMPILPGLWLLCGLAIERLARGRMAIRVLALSVVIALPLWNLVGQDYVWTLTDTRVLAKRWIESSVPPDSKILVDGMRFRFVQGPPLNPNAAAIERRLSGAGSSELTVSPRMLSLYAEAQKRVSGPKYDLHSTVYGLEVRELDDYVRECFDYVVTSSLNESRYATEESRARFPKSARFYDEIRTDSRFERVYRVEPVLRKQPGPTITVYRISPRCGAR